MAYKLTFDLTPLIEQGNISSRGDSDSNTRVRTGGRIAIDLPTSATITAISNTGKTLQVDFLGYADSSTNTPICDLYWYDSPYTFDLSQYSGIRYVRAVIKNSDNTNISPADIASAKIELIAPNAWYMSEDGYPKYSLFPELPASPMEKPYPKALWRIDPQINGGYPYHELMPGLVRKGPGAFCNAIHLTRVRIPESVKTIGEKAFANTALRSVTIAPDCTYSETSFPPGCEVNFYGGGGQYGQLVDCNGVEILDCEAVRIFVKGE
ncbi:MAG TPA: leucine-rich repeat protein [Ruminococcus sp.]|nr:leucine-rich repeat protein [Ruminococcus sp.]